MNDVSQRKFGELYEDDSTSSGAIKHTVMRRGIRVSKLQFRLHNVPLLSNPLLFAYR